MLQIMLQIYVIYLLMLQIYATDSAQWLLAAVYARTALTVGV